MAIVTIAAAVVAIVTTAAAESPSQVGAFCTRCKLTVFQAHQVSFNGIFDVNFDRPSVNCLLYIFVSHNLIVVFKINCS